MGYGLRTDAGDNGQVGDSPAHAKRSRARVVSRFSEPSETHGLGLRTPIGFNFRGPQGAQYKAERAAKCDFCNGLRRLFRCGACAGSGRRASIPDGGYGNSGGMCSCGGSGQVVCPACGGPGRKGDFGARMAEKRGTVATRNARQRARNRLAKAGPKKVGRGRGIKIVARRRK